MAYPEALILAGPNGAGKTTVSATLVTDGTRFLNSDLVAARLMDEGHGRRGVEVAAGRIILEQLRGAVAEGVPFCIETNLAGRGLTRRIDDGRAAGYVVRLAFVALDSPALALRRVAARVALGGHNVPESVVRRRWAAGLRSLFDLYLPIVDSWEIYDNTNGLLQLVSGKGREAPAHQIFDQERWSQLLVLAAQVGALAARPSGEFFDSVAPVDDNGSSKH